MRKAVAFGVIALAGLALMCEFVVPIGGIMWSGRFLLTVEIAVDGDLPQRVSAHVFESRKIAAQACAERDFQKSTEMPMVSVEPFVGQPLIIPVECDGQTSLLLGREMNWSQRVEYLVVVAEWSDGRRVAKMVAAPNGRICRTVQVDINSVPR